MFFSFFCKFYKLDGLIKFTNLEVAGFAFGNLAAITVEVRGPVRPYHLTPWVGATVWAVITVEVLFSPNMRYLYDDISLFFDLKICYVFEGKVAGGG